MLTKPPKDSSKLLAARSPEFFEQKLKEGFGEKGGKAFSGVNSHSKTPDLYDPTEKIVKQ